MKIKNARLLQEFRTAGRCEICQAHVAKREPHHLWRRTPEITIRINLIALGGVLKLPDGGEVVLCPCHRSIHAGLISASRVLEVVAKREGCRPEDIEEVMAWMRRLVKPTDLQVERALGELSDGAKPLAMKQLMEVPAKRVRKNPVRKEMR